ncbi:hypothetical protein ABEB36_004818 [Hypothenemus hampei]|uniref:Uncharacterized protein n=1 Tax=Hypothenemus hampei TaxID=57062 RepID=A0ABD1EWY8_HYPHA
MALFGMVWLLRVRAELKRCAKCQANGRRTERRSVSRATTFFTIDGAVDDIRSSAQKEDEGTTFCEVHGFISPDQDLNAALPS